MYLYINNIAIIMYTLKKNKNKDHINVFEVYRFHHV